MNQIQGEKIVKYNRMIAGGRSQVAGSGGVGCEAVTAHKKTGGQHLLPAAGAHIFCCLSPIKRNSD